MRLWLRHQSTHVRLHAGTGFIIGSDSRCDLRLDDPSASPRHARLSARADGVLIEDLTGAGGVSVRGMPVTTPMLLLPGTDFQIGLARFVIHGDGDVTQGEDQSTMDLSQLIAREARGRTPVPPSVQSSESPLAIVNLGRELLIDRTMPVADQFSGALALVQKLVDLKADAYARQLFLDAVDLLAQRRTQGVIPIGITARARKIITRWTANQPPSGTWAERQQTLTRAEKLE